MYIGASRPSFTTAKEVQKSEKDNPTDYATRDRTVGISFLRDSEAIVNAIKSYIMGER